MQWAQFDAISALSKLPSFGRGVTCSSELMNCELTVTACFVRALDQFLVPDSECGGGCFHQLPIQRSLVSKDLTWSTHTCVHV